MTRKQQARQWQMVEMWYWRIFGLASVVVALGVMWYGWKIITP